jgi:DNA-binding NarL/FixJ family response regulator
MKKIVGLYESTTYKSMPDILIVDDHPIVAEGLQKLIASYKLADKCVTVYSAGECQKCLKLFKPDLVILDYHLPDGNGIDLCKNIKRDNPSIKVLAISSFKEQSIVKHMIGNGASGYVLKNASEEEIVDAIQTVLKGKVYLCEESQDIIEKRDVHTIITEREIEVIKLIAEGLTNAEIAEKLFLSPLTVDRHRKNVIIKLDAKNTASLISIAIHKGII